MWIIHLATETSARLARSYALAAEENNASSPSRLLEKHGYQLMETSAASLNKIDLGIMIVKIRLIHLWENISATSQESATLDKKDLAETTSRYS